MVVHRLQLSTRRLLQYMPLGVLHNHSHHLKQQQQQVVEV
jgi:hypothetical protein